MLLRPVDASGDILPVLSSGDLLRGSEAVAQLVRERLELYAGDWWENSDWGNEVLQMLQETRLTEADGQVLASYLTSYIRETPGVENVSDVTFYVENGKQFSYKGTVVTEYGYAGIEYETGGPE